MVLTYGLPERNIQRVFFIPSDRTRGPDARSASTRWRPFCSPDGSRTKKNAALLSTNQKSPARKSYSRLVKSHDPFDRPKQFSKILYSALLDGHFIALHLLLLLVSSLSQAIFIIAAVTTVRWLYRLSVAFHECGP